MILTDYLETLRRYALFILLTALVCAAAGFGYSKLQTEEYEATASVSVSDPAQAQNLLGRGVFTGDTPLQIATGHAPQVTRAPVLQQASKDVKRHLSASDIDGALDVEVNPN